MSTNVLNRRIIYTPALLTGVAGGGEDSATTAWVAAVVGAGGTVGTTRRGIVDTFIKALKSAGIYTTLDRYWLFGGESQIQSTVDMSPANEVALLLNTPSWSASTGFTAAGGGVYIRTSIIPNMGGIQFAQNSATYGGQVQNNRTVSSPAVIFGAANAAFNSVNSLSPFYAGGIDFKVNSDSSDGGTGSGSQGSWIMSRTGANVITAYLNGTNLATGVTSSAALGDGNFLVLATSQGGNTPAAYAEPGDQCTSFFIASGWNSTQAAAFEAAQNAMMTSIGINLH